MTTKTYEPGAELHSSAWVLQTKIQFGVAASAMLIGITMLPLEIWARMYLLMGSLLLCGSSLTLAKTLRDIHESSRLIHRVDEARIERILNAHDPFQAA